MSDLEETRQQAIEYIKENPECTLTEVIKNIEHHYASDQGSVGALSEWINRADTPIVDVSDPGTRASSLVYDGEEVHQGEENERDRVGEVATIKVRRAGTRYVAKFVSSAESIGAGDTAVGAMLRLCLSMMDDKEFRRSSDAITRSEKTVDGILGRGRS